MAQGVNDKTRGIVINPFFLTLFIIIVCFWIIIGVLVIKSTIGNSFIHKEVNQTLNPNFVGQGKTLTEEQKELVQTNLQKINIEISDNIVDQLDHLRFVITPKADGKVLGKRVRMGKKTALVGVRIESKAEIGATTVFLDYNKDQLQDHNSAISLLNAETQVTLIEVLFPHKDKETLQDLIREFSRIELPIWTESDL